jgi:hypothetical protein
VEVQRQRFKCKQLLRDFCSKHGLEPRDIQGKAQFRPIVTLRKQFIRLAWHSGCGLTAVARTVKRDQTTVDYHIRGLREARRMQTKALEQRQREEIHVTYQG